ncbi:MAG: L-threonylcarbamoyladenylate synthase [Proteobacteria bacterium]|nr:L-threonylcarbamoyladenylate synthase [Pseudomonadota bacterium]
MASDFAISHAVHIIHQGGVIAYPTDTIYGLGCDPYNLEAIEKINRIKQRPEDKHFILLAGNVDQLQPLIDIDEQQIKTIIETGLQVDQATSWVVTASERAPYWLVDDNNSLTIRITSQRDVTRLCHRLGHAIISTSANPSGRKPAINSLQLHQYFHYDVDKIITASQPLTAKPSKIIRLCDNYVIRA